MNRFPYHGADVSPNELSFPAEAWTIISPGSVFAGSAGVRFPNNGTPAITGAFGIPPTWQGKQIWVDLLWRNTTPGTGDVRWAVELTNAYDASPGTVSLGTAFVVDASQNSNAIFQTCSAGSLIAGTVTSNNFLVCRVIRNPADAEDTFEHTVTLFAVRIRVRDID